MFEQTFAITSLPNAPATRDYCVSSPTTSNHYYLDYTPFPSQGDFRPTFYNPFEIKHRRRTSRAQLKVLEKSFSENPKPNATVRRILAQKLDMTPRGVQIWFQNRRAKAKLQRRKSANANGTLADGSQSDDIIAIAASQSSIDSPDHSPADCQHQQLKCEDLSHYAQQMVSSPDHGSVTSSNPVLFSQFLAQSPCETTHTNTTPMTSYVPVTKQEGVAQKDWSESARAVAEAAAASCYVGYHNQPHQQLSAQHPQPHQPIAPFMLEDWLSMPLHPLAPVIQSDHDDLMMSGISADDWRRKSCPALGYPNVAAAQQVERRVSEPTHYDLAIEQSNNMEFYYPVEYYSPQDRGQQLTPLLSTGSRSPASLDMDPALFATADSFMANAALI